MWDGAGEGQSDANVSVQRAAGPGSRCAARPLWAPGETNPYLMKNRVAACCMWAP